MNGYKVFFLVVVFQGLLAVLTVGALIAMNYQNIRAVTSLISIASCAIGGLAGVMISRPK